MEILLSFIVLPVMYLVGTPLILAYALIRLLFGGNFMDAVSDGFDAIAWIWDKID